MPETRTIHSPLGATRLACLALALAVCSLLALPALAGAEVTIGSSLPAPTGGGNATAATRRAIRAISHAS